MSLQDTRRSGGHPALFSLNDPVSLAVRALADALAGGETVAGRLTLTDARHLVTEQLVATGAVTDLSLARLVGLWARFDRFADRVCGVVRVHDVDAHVVAEFLRAKATTGRAPSPSTVRMRLTAVRLLFRVLRQLRLATGDPTLDASLPTRAYPGFRALTDDEIDRCRWASLTTVVTTRDPAVWALAEAGASTGEIGFVRTADLDPGGARVFVPGGRKAVARWLPLSEWAEAQLCRRARELGSDTYLTYAGDGSFDSRRSSVTAVLTRVLRRAGLGDAPGVEPRSITAWVGAQVFADTGRIEAVAHRLGLRSLDRAAGLIGWEWQLPPPEGA